MGDSDAGDGVQEGKDSEGLDPHSTTILVVRENCISQTRPKEEDVVQRWRKVAPTLDYTFVATDRTRS